MTGDDYRAEARRLGDVARRIYADHEPLNAERVELNRVPWQVRTPEQNARLDELDRSPLYGYYVTVDKAATALRQAAEWADRQAAKL